MVVIGGNQGDEICFELMSRGAAGEAFFVPTAYLNFATKDGAVLADIDIDALRREFGDAVKISDKQVHMKTIRGNALRHRVVCYAVLCVASLLVTPLSHGGAKGFTVVMIDIGGQDFFGSKVYKANADGDFLESKKWQECWESRATGGKSFEMVVKKKIPDGLSQEMAQTIWDGDNGVAKKAQKILLHAKAPNGKAIDGMYVINARDGRISVMALGARGLIGPKNPSRKVSVPWNDSEPEKSAADFDLALCSISHPLDAGFSP